MATAVSAPGKVLLTGGYLVLDQKHTGLVFGLDARIHVQVTPVPTTNGVSLQEIIVRSPQFKDALWRYGYHGTRQDGGIEVTQLRDLSNVDSRPNLFVQVALAYTLSYISTIIRPLVIEPVAITILADNDYYSQEDASVDLQRSSKHSKFKNFNISIWDAHKTGLGSSAALVTSLIGAVLVHYLSGEGFSLASEPEKRKLHNLAQAAHSAAQGKVGSGFDVAAAVYGSCVYRRFSPSLLESLGDVGSANFALNLQAIVEESSERTKWDTQVLKSAVKIPQSLRLTMCDVDCGSQTPGMVKKVLEWRKNCPQKATALWEDLQERNDQLAAQLVHLADQKNPDFQSLRQNIQNIRQLVRDMSTDSGVPIEPNAQTDLLNACSNVPGVVGGMAPGAGGYDAVALLVEDRQDVVDQLNSFLESWKFEVDESGTKSMGKVRVLGVREEMQGIQLEDPSKYESWTS